MFELCLLCSACLAALSSFVQLDHLSISAWDYPVTVVLFSAASTVSSCTSTESMDNQPRRCHGVMTVISSTTPLNITRQAGRPDPDSRFKCQATDAGRAVTEIAWDTDYVIQPLPFELPVYTIPLSAQRPPARTDSCPAGAPMPQHPRAATALCPAEQSAGVAASRECFKVIAETGPGDSLVGR